eukprot:29007-Pelagococcus_subviridis.AAC.3
MESRRDAPPPTPPPPPPGAYGDGFACAFSAVAALAALAAFWPPLGRSLPPPPFFATFSCTGLRHPFGAPIAALTPPGGDTLRDEPLRSLIESSIESTSARFSSETSYSSSNPPPPPNECFRECLLPPFATTPLLSVALALAASASASMRIAPSGTTEAPWPSVASVVVSDCFFPFFPFFLLLLLSQSRVNARYRASSWDIPQFSGRSKSSSSTIFALV